MSRNLGVTGHLAWDFEEFDRHVKAMARGLLSMGVNKGDRVGVIMGNNRYVKTLGLIRGLGGGLTVGFSSYATLQWACASIGG